MPEVAKFVEATEYVLARTPSDRASIVCASILSALEGRFGDVHRTARTLGSELFINPLMSFCWCFRLDAIARRVLYLDAIRDVSSYAHLSTVVDQFHLSQMGNVRGKRALPM